MRDSGNLLTRAGLAVPTVDTDSFTMRYASPQQLIQHLRVRGGFLKRVLVAPAEGEGLHGAVLAGQHLRVRGGFSKRVLVARAELIPSAVSCVD